MGLEEDLNREYDPELDARFRDKMAKLEQSYADRKIAKYKIELFFGDERSITKPVPGVMSFFESGAQLNGDGDVKIYMCPGKIREKNECDKFIPWRFNSHGFLLCQECKSLWKNEEVVGEVMGRHHMRDWAKLLFIYFNRLGLNCDIYLKHAPDDIRSRAQQEQERQKGGELLAKARKRALHIYPLNNILRDTLGGVDLEKRFFSFLTA